MSWPGTQLCSDCGRVWRPERNGRYSLARPYSTAKQENPTVLYVDRDCCGAQSWTAGKIQELLSVWPDIIVRLDI